MIDALHELHRILLAHDHPGQAEIVAELISLHATGRDRFVQLLHSVDMWGGSGAVWEVGDVGSDTRAFRDAIIRLADQMEHEGLGNERSHFIAQTFRNWNRSGV